MKNVGEITKAIDSAKGVIDGAKGVVDGAKEIANNGINFVKGISNKDLMLYGGIAVGVILLLIIFGAAIKINKRRGSRPYYTNGAVGVGAGAGIYVDKRAQRRAERREDRYYRELIRLKRREDYYKPRKRQVLYVKTMAPKANKQVKTQTVYATADQATMMATGIVGMGIGAMAYSALLNEKKKFQL